MSIVVHRTRRDLLTVTGPEAVTWLQGQLSQDVAGLAVGAASWTFVLTPQGKVDGWGRVQRRDEETVRVDVDAGAGDHWRERLQRFKLRTKADIELRPDVALLAVRGARVNGDLPAGWPGVVGGDLLDPPDDVVATLLGGGAVEIDADAYEALRIRAGVPRWGAELDGDTIPASAGRWVIDSSVSFTKGCYTGQELVARIDSRGNNVPRSLAAVVLDGPPPAPGAVVSADGRPAGAVTSSAPDAATGGSVALAFIARTVQLPSDGEISGRAVRLEALPLSSPPEPDAGGGRSRRSPTGTGSP